MRRTVGVVSPSGGCSSSEWQQAFSPLTEAVQHLGRAVKPILRGREGSRGRRPCGSAFVLVRDGRFVVVTAAHVIEDGPEPRYLGLAERTSIRWPADYRRLNRVSESEPDPDLAYAHLPEPTSPDPGVADAFPLASVPLELMPQKGMAFLAVGHPASKSRLTPSTGSLKAGLAHISGEAVPLSEYDRLALDPRVHLAMEYTPHDIRLFDGSAATGPSPHGMSGGALLLVTSDSRQRMLINPVGVLTRYLPDRGALVATRLDLLLARFRRHRAS